VVIGPSGSGQITPVHSRGDYGDIDSVEKLVGSGRDHTELTVPGYGAFGHKPDDSSVLQDLQNLSQRGCIGNALSLFDCARRLQNRGGQRVLEIAGGHGPHDRILHKGFDQYSVYEIGVVSHKKEGRIGDPFGVYGVKIVALYERASKNRSQCPPYQLIAGQSHFSQRAHFPEKNMIIIPASTG